MYTYGQAVRQPWLQLTSRIPRSKCIYLSVIRHLHMSEGYHDHFNLQLTPRLQLVLWGIKKYQSSTLPGKIRLPITIQIMCGLKKVLSREPQSYNNIMLWAACCLVFFGFGEFTIQNQDGYDKSPHLSFSDISVNSWGQPNLLKVMIKQSKFDPFCKDVNAYLGAAKKPKCPILGILPYLAVRGNQEGSLYHREWQGFDPANFLNNA